MITLSNHTSFQDGIFSMYENLKERFNVYTISLANSDYPASGDSHNLYVDAPLKPGITKKTFDLYSLHQMMKKIKKVSADVIYFESLHVWNYPVVIYCKIKKIKIAHTINDVIPHEGDNNRGISDFLNKMTTIFSDYIVMRSADGLEKAKAKFSKQSSKMRKVDIWYSFPPYRGPVGRSVLFFGRMNKYKGLNKLCELIKMTPDVNYIVAGKADDTVDNELRELKKFNNVVIDERRIPYPQMHDYFYNSCCVVLPYETATQSGVVIDGYKHSRPSIAFDVGAISDEIEDGISGYVIEPGNVIDMADKIRKVVSMSDEKLESLCKQSYYYGLDNYSAKSKEKEFLTAIGIQNEKEV